jgi:hypothetical protein
MALTYEHANLPMPSFALLRECSEASTSRLVASFFALSASVRRGTARLESRFSRSSVQLCGRVDVYGPRRRSIIVYSRRDRRDTGRSRSESGQRQRQRMAQRTHVSSAGTDPQRRAQGDGNDDGEYAFGARRVHGSRQGETGATRGAAAAQAGKESRVQTAFTKEGRGRRTGTCPRKGSCSRNGIVAGGGGRDVDPGYHLRVHQ